MTFNSPNTYSGGTKIVSGSLTMGAAGTLGNSSGALNVSAAGSLNLGGTTQLVGPVGAIGNGVTGSISNGTLNVQGGNAVILQSGTFTANLTATDSNTQLLIGGDAGGILLLGGVNSITSFDGSSAIIGGSQTGRRVP